MVSKANSWNILKKWSFMSPFFVLNIETSGVYLVKKEINSTWLPMEKKWTMNEDVFPAHVALLEGT